MRDQLTQFPAVFELTKSHEKKTIEMKNSRAACPNDNSDENGTRTKASCEAKDTLPMSESKVDRGGKKGGRKKKKNGKKTGK